MTTTNIEESSFSGIKKGLKERFEGLIRKNKQQENVLFSVKYDRDVLYSVYLDAFKDEAKRQSHNCNCCSSFIRHVGGAVLVSKDLEVTDIWDPESPSPGVRALAAYVKKRPIDGLFFHHSVDAGTDRNTSVHTKIVWEHFHAKIPDTLVNNEKDGNTLGKKSDKKRKVATPALDK